MKAPQPSECANECVNTVMWDCTASPPSLLQSNDASNVELVFVITKTTPVLCGQLWSLRKVAEMDENEYESIW